MIYFLLIASVLLGGLIVTLFKPKQFTVELLLAFSGAYLLSITILHLLPEIYEHEYSEPHDNHFIGVFILIGILIQSLLEFFSKGAEHGHIHLPSDSTRFPWLLFVSLSLHALSEGVPIGYENNSDLLWAIVIHKIPISIVLATFLLQSKLKQRYVFIFVLLFSLMSPLGVLASEKSSVFTHYHHEVTAISIGIFLHISTVILFESSKNHKFDYSKFIAIFLGMILALIL